MLSLQEAHDVELSYYFTSDVNFWCLPGFFTVKFHFLLCNLKYLVEKYIETT